MLAFYGRGYVDNSGGTRRANPVQVIFGDVGTKTRFWSRWESWEVQLTESLLVRLVMIACQMMSFPRGSKFGIVRQCNWHPTGCRMVWQTLRGLIPPIVISKLRQ